MRQIDSKYKTNGDLTRSDGTPIPADEPLMLFRSTDKLFPEMLEYYRQLCAAAGSPDDHLSSLDESIAKVRQWQEANPDKVDTPD